MHRSSRPSIHHNVTLRHYKLITRYMVELSACKRAPKHLGLENVYMVNNEAVTAIVQCGVIAATSLCFLGLQPGNS